MIRNRTEIKTVRTRMVMEVVFIPNTRSRVRLDIIITAILRAKPIATLVITLSSSFFGYKAQMMTYPGIKKINNKLINTHRDDIIIPAISK